MTHLGESVRLLLGDGRQFFNDTAFDEVLTWRRTFFPRSPFSLMASELEFTKVTMSHHTSFSYGSKSDE